MLPLPASSALTLTLGGGTEPLAGNLGTRLEGAAARNAPPDRIHERAPHVFRIWSASWEIQRGSERAISFVPRPDAATLGVPARARRFRRDVESEIYNVGAGYDDVCAIARPANIDLRAVRRA
ncbi:hypothetical protein R75777_04171 [Paraburkholderia nemoris]|nr:hypothetical protein R75777_04171 [Paraburkholderia nemoris]